MEFVTTVVVLGLLMQVFDFSPTLSEQEGYSPFKWKRGFSKDYLKDTVLSACGMGGQDSYCPARNLLNNRNLRDNLVC